MGWHPIQHHADRLLRHRHAQDLPRILRRALRIIGNYPSDLVIFQNFTGCSPILADKKTRTVFNSRQALMRAASHAGLIRPIGDLWRKPPRRKEWVILRRLQIERHFAQLLRFIALCHAISQLASFGQSLSSQSRNIGKIDKKNAIQTAVRDLIGPSKDGIARAKISTKKYPQRACQIVRI